MPITSFLGLPWVEAAIHPASTARRNVGKILLFVGEKIYNKFMIHNSFNNVNDRLEEEEHMRPILPANDIGTPIQSYMF